MNAKTDSRVDVYIEKAPPFARPVLTHLRRLVHAACPDVEETVKWSRPAFLQGGRMLCSMVAFQAHCGFGFWHPEVSALVGREVGKSEEGSGQFGRIASVDDLPDDETMRRYLAEAVRLGQNGRAVRPKKPAVGARRPEADVPADLAALFQEHPVARATFEKFSPSHRREYVEWITEAKREETRAKRLATTLEWLAQGKPRNWQYQNC